MNERINCQAFRVRTGQQTDVLGNMMVKNAQHGAGRVFIDPVLDERRPVVKEINHNLPFALSQENPPALVDLGDLYRRVSEFSLDLDFDKQLANAGVTNPIDMYKPSAKPIGSFALVSIIDRTPKSIEQGQPNIVENEDSQIIQTLALGDVACGVAVCVVLIPENEGIVFKSDKEYKLSYSLQEGVALTPLEQTVELA